MYQLTHEEFLRDETDKFILNETPFDRIKFIWNNGTFRQKNDSLPKILTLANITGFSFLTCNFMSGALIGALNALKCSKAKNRYTAYPSIIAAQRVHFLSMGKMALVRGMQNCLSTAPFIGLSLFVWLHCMTYSNQLSIHQFPISTGSNIFSIAGMATKWHRGFKGSLGGALIGLTLGLITTPIISLSAYMTGFDVAQYHYQDIYKIIEHDNWHHKKI
ncbi:hypothetical protein A3Q56_00593 [Intoshia linei]|uniref:Uncharacterized protein n=1 Tax=Intoshia linei TaxID=1819745 RepID=A0A177BBC0_9BILA|nr:hypothetical protein A3Q56_00593 [Intoshia linei]